MIYQCKRLKHFTHLIEPFYEAKALLARKVNKRFKAERNFVKYSVSLLANSCPLSDVLLILKNLFNLLLWKFSAVRLITARHRKTPQDTARHRKTPQDAHKTPQDTARQLQDTARDLKKDACKVIIDIQGYGGVLWVSCGVLRCLAVSCGVLR